MMPHIDFLMKLGYWKKYPNFGDGLNVWLWPRLLPDFFDDDEKTAFFGIGSILGLPITADWRSQPERILVVGSGYGGAGYSKPRLDDRWKIYFVRGPRSAKAFGLDLAMGLGDPASLVRRVDEVRMLPRGTKGPAYMPHWNSAVHGNWRHVAMQAGMRYIDPLADVPKVIEEIAASTILVTEALHGAIVADALRVPWIPIAPNPDHQFKWRDWVDAMGIELNFSQAKPTTLVEAVSRRYSGRMHLRTLRHASKFDLRVANALFTRNAVSALQQALTTTPTLSSESVLEARLEAMMMKLATVRRDLAFH